MQQLRQALAAAAAGVRDVVAAEQGAVAASEAVATRAVKLGMGSAEVGAEARAAAQGACVPPTTPIDHKR